MVLPMARDLMDLGIRVNAIMPSIFATPPMLRFKEMNPPMYENLEKSVPFPRRLGQPDEFASLAMELARNSYINAQTFRIDGAIRFPRADQPHILTPIAGRVAPAARPFLRTCKNKILS